jgi:hypothetical protein
MVAARNKTGHSARDDEKTIESAPSGGSVIAGDFQEQGEFPLQ